VLIAIAVQLVLAQIASKLLMPWQHQAVPQGTAFFVCLQHFVVRQDLNTKFYNAYPK
jgi:hypothetical protein